MRSAFFEPTIAGPCQHMVVVPDTQGCQRACDLQTDFACDGIHVFPATMPATVYKTLRSVSFVLNGTSCPIAAASRLPPTTLICQPVKQRVKVPLIPVDSFRVTSDPEGAVRVRLGGALCLSCCLRVRGVCLCV